MKRQQGAVRNAYSDTWFELFLDQPDPVQTAHEVAFLSRNLPRSEVTTVLDVCSGYGRHAAPLAETGYHVTGIDRDERVIKQARSLHAGEGLSFGAHDMTRLHDLPGTFDAVICMWQSFGYFDAATNKNVLSQMAERLHPGGRLVLDLYNRDFFKTHQGAWSSVRHGVEVVTNQWMDGDRLIAELEYRSNTPDERDVFDWQLFTPQSIRELAESGGLHGVLVCTRCDENQSPSAGHPRMQLVFEKR